jgi:hypothetical protein
MITPTIRPAAVICCAFCVLLLSAAVLVGRVSDLRVTQSARWQRLRSLVKVLGTSDLALTTEARYTRHPLASDRVAVGMEQPGAVDHFPSTFFFQPPQ